LSAELYNTDSQYFHFPAGACRGVRKIVYRPSSPGECCKIEENGKCFNKRKKGEMGKIEEKWHL
jgi:hypothetical protein